jgi:hypothetical protein
MVVEVFVTKGDAEYTLSQHSFLLMDNEEFVAWIRDAAIDGFGEAEPFVNLSQKQCPCI